MTAGRTTTFAILFTAALAAPVLAQDDDTINMGGAVEAVTLVPAQRVAINYDFNLGGFSLGSGQLRATFTDDTYEASTDLRTGGLADWLFQSRYLNTSAGSRDGRVIHPDHYTSDFRGKRDDDYQIVRIGYDDTTPYLVEADPSYGRRLERFPVTDEQREGSFDPLNAAIHLVTGMTFSAERPCGENVRIFDGRRRYDLIMTHVGEEEVSIRNGEVWDGAATVCELNYEEVAGFKPQPEDDELPRPPMTLYIGHVEDGDFYIPLRVRAPTPIGGVVMVASHFRIRDTQVALGETGTAEMFDASMAAPAE